MRSFGASRDILLAAAVGALLVVLAERGQLSGWISWWHGARGERALADAERSESDEAALEMALAELSQAFSASPISRRYRIELETTLDQSILRLGSAKVAALAPEAVSPRVAFAAALERQGQSEAARDLLSTVRRATPEEVLTFSDRMLWKIAAEIVRSDSCADSITILEAAVERVDDPSGLELGYGRCLVRAGKPERAIPLLERLHGESPAANWPAFFLAEACLASGDVARADELSREITSRSPTFYYGWNLRGQLLEQLGQQREAADSYERALGIRPANTWLRNRIARLRMP